MSGVKSDLPSTLSPVQWSCTPKKSAKIEICQQSKLSNTASSALPYTHMMKVQSEDGGDLKLWAAGRNGT